MRKTEKLFMVLMAISLLVSASSCVAEKRANKGGEEELKERMEITNKKRVTSKEVERFEEKLQSYFFEIVETEAISGAIKSLPPGDAMTAVVTASLSKKPVEQIIELKKAGKTWTEITGSMGIDMKDVVKEVKEFQKMSGCA
ncbi:MAG: hypothetical protein AB1499_07375 [Nitrospirota bacterium]